LPVGWDIEISLKDGRTLAAVILEDPSRITAERAR
jgi:hypothetical protein